MLPQGRARKGHRRIDAAIDWFTAMGYTPRVIRAAVADLLKVYGSPDAWLLLEEGSYRVVQDKLFEMEKEEEQKEDAHAPAADAPADGPSAPVGAPGPQGGVEDLPGNEDDNDDSTN